MKERVSCPIGFYIVLYLSFIHQDSKSVSFRLWPPGETFWQKSYILRQEIIRGDVSLQHSGPRLTSTIIHHCAPHPRMMSLCCARMIPLVWEERNAHVAPIWRWLYYPDGWTHCNCTISASLLRTLMSYQFLCL